jgi:hypothetical protein
MGLSLEIAKHHRNPIAFVETLDLLVHNRGYVVKSAFGRRYRCTLACLSFGPLPSLAVAARV